MRSFVLIAGGAVIAIAIAALLLVGGDGGPEPAAAVGPGAARPSDSTAAQRPFRISENTVPAPGLEAPPSLGQVPRSLQETDVDGALRVDAQGNLIVDEEVRFLFDYFLIAVEDEPEANIRARVIAELRKRLPAKAAGQAIELFEKYLGYREAAHDLASNPRAAEDLDARLADLKRIRREKLGAAAADAIFGEEEAFDTVTLARKRLEADESIPLEERRRKIEALESQLPPALQLQRAQAMAPLRNLQEEEAMIRAGATAEDVEEFRKQTVGAAAAERLKKMEREEAEFLARVAAFRTVRAKLIADGASAAQLEQAMVQAFPREPERLRVITLVELQP